MKNFDKHVKIIMEKLNLNERSISTGGRYGHEIEQIHNQNKQILDAPKYKTFATKLKIKLDLTTSFRSLSDVFSDDTLNEYEGWYMYLLSDMQKYFKNNNTRGSSKYDASSEKKAIIQIWLSACAKIFSTCISTIKIEPKESYIDTLINMPPAAVTEYAKIMDTAKREVAKTGMQIPDDKFYMMFNDMIRITLENVARAPDKYVGKTYIEWLRLFNDIYNVKKYMYENKKQKYTIKQRVV